MAVIDQAGAIVIRSDGDVRKILLVTSRRNPAHWVFPKGHVEPGETLEETALREAHEEAGIRGTIVHAAGTLSFDLDGHTYRVHYFVVTTDDDGEPEPGRRLAWYSYEEALEKLSFGTAHELLRRAWETLPARP